MEHSFCDFVSDGLVPARVAGHATMYSARLVGSVVIIATKTLAKGFYHYPKSTLAMGTAVYVSYGVIKMHLRLTRYHSCNHEFVPQEHQVNVTYRYIKTTLRFTWGYVRYLYYTWGGLFPLSVRDYTSIIDKSRIPIADARPLLIPAGEKIEIFPCNSVHSHPRSAEFRSAAGNFITELLAKAGYTPYHVSAAKRDLGKGSRYYYCTKDMSQPMRDDPIEENSAIEMTDVDYYADMPRWLALRKPIVMYTLVPQSISFSNGEQSYYFENNEVVFHVAGGGKYQHQLWDYKGDVVTALDLDGNLIVYELEQRLIKGDEHHRIIALMPRAVITDPLFLTMKLDWLDNLLQRKTVTQGDLNVLWEPIDDVLSVGRVDSKYSVTITGKLFAAIKARLAHKDSAPFVSDVERMLKEEKHPNYARDAPILFECIERNITLRQNVVKTGSFPTVFAAIPKKGALSTEDTKRPGQVVTTPMVSQPSLFAAKGYNADVACIEGRIDKVCNHVRFPRKYRNYASEFVDRLVPLESIGKGVPLSFREVRALQNKKAQRGRFDRIAPIMSTSAENSIRSFIKTEPYSAAKAPRNISTMSPDITIQSSAYSLPMANILKNHHWYCPGKAPRAIVDRLHEVMKRDLQEDLEEGDYTCLDGTQSADYSDLLLLPMYMRYLAPEHRGEFKRLYKQIYTKKAVTSNGVSYKPRMTVRSGSSITTQAGTLCNAFNVYSALRNMGYDAGGAWDRIGAIFGDDSLNANYDGIFREHIEQVSRELGMIYKSNLRPRGEPVLFLGRYFVDPTTTYDSFADPLRTIGKLHLSSNNSVSPEQAAANKAHGYHTTDALTPIIGTWASRVLEITKLAFKSGTGEEQYKCSNAWPQRDRRAICESMAFVLGLSVAEVEIIDAEVRRVEGLDQFPVVLETTYAHKQCAVVDGELVGTDLHADIVQPPPTPIPQDERQSEASPNSVQRPRRKAIRRGRNARRTTETGTKQRRKPPREGRAKGEGVPVQLPTADGDGSVTPPPPSSAGRGGRRRQRNERIFNNRNAQENQADWRQVYRDVTA